jgi:hypothetical protein
MLVLEIYYWFPRDSTKPLGRRFPVRFEATFRFGEEKGDQTFRGLERVEYRREWAA